MVTSCWSREPLITPLPRSAEVTRTPSSCAAPSAAFQARSNGLGGGGGGVSYVVHATSTQPLTMITAIDARTRWKLPQTERNRIARCAFNKPDTSNGLRLKLCSFCFFGPIDCVDNLLHLSPVSSRVLATGKALAGCSIDPKRGARKIDELRRTYSPLQRGDFSATKHMGHFQQPVSALT
jgi:hypothetical protein